MTEELAEQVETVYADVYMYPLGAALAAARGGGVLAGEREAAKGKGGGERAGIRARRTSTGTGTRTGMAVEVAGVLLLLLGMRVESFAAVRAPGAGGEDGHRGARCGRCGERGDCWRRTSLPDLRGRRTRDSRRRFAQRPFASLDLGLALFQLGERYGLRFGEEDRSRDGRPVASRGAALAELRNTEVECALRVVLAIANEIDVPIDFAHAPTTSRAISSSCATPTPKRCATTTSR